MDILKRISAYKAESEKLAWTGTFTEYLELLKQDPTPAMTAHARVYEMIESFGVVEDGGARRNTSFLNKRFLDWTGRLRSWWRNISIPRHDGWMYANGSCC